MHAVISPPTPSSIAPICQSVSPEGMRAARYALALEDVPADFYADPDGSWTFEALARAAGFAPDAGVAVGALREPFNGHPDGSAVVTLNAESRPYVAIIECPIAFTYVRDAERYQVSAA